MRRRFLRASRGPFRFSYFRRRPDPRATPEILDLLAEKGVKASVFRLEKTWERILSLLTNDEGARPGRHGQDPFERSLQFTMETGALDQAVDSGSDRWEAWRIAFSVLRMGS
jgi:hypothetical protein